MLIIDAITFLNDSHTSVVIKGESGIDIVATYNYTLSEAQAGALLSKINNAMQKVEGLDVIEINPELWTITEDK
jgi:hypothetical protein